MSNAFVRVPPDSTGKRIDNISLDDEGVAVYRQIIAVGGSATATVALVTNASAGAADYGLVVRPTTATVVVSGGIGISGTAQVAIGTPIVVNNISAAVTVTGGVAISGTAQVAIGTPIVVNNISAAVTVTGGVAISGTAQVAIGTPIVVNNISAAVTVTGGVAISGTAQVAIGTAINVNPVGISGTAQVAIGTPIVVNNISAAVTVTGGVAISGTAQVAIGTPIVVNNISAAVTVTGGVAISGTAQVAIGTPIVVNNISAAVTVSPHLVSVTGTVIVAISTPYILQGISTTVLVAGVVSLGAGTNLIGAVSLAAGTANFGTLNDISRTVQVAVGTPFILQGISTTVTVAGTINLDAAPAVMSASRGPKCITASTSANVTLIASPGAGLNIYVTKLFCSNASGTGFAMRVGTSASIQTVVGFAASSGGGFVFDFGDKPWMLSASEAALCSVKPNASYGLFNVHFYVK